MAETYKDTIVLDDILRGKMGDKSKFVPGFVKNRLKKLINLDEINRFVWESRDKAGTDWLIACVRYLDMRLQIKGLENLPDKDNGKRYIFVSNHPLGGPDGVALGSIIGKKYEGKFRYLVNDFLLYLPGLRPVCIGIDKTGGIQNREFPQKVEGGFQSENHILMFPAGICSRKINGVIRDTPWKKTFVRKSVQYHRDVVPIHFEGRNSDKFYRLASFWDKMPLKANPAMLFLVQEMYKNVHKTFPITIGKPIPWQTFDNRKSPRQWAGYVQELVYHL